MKEENKVENMTQLILIVINFNRFHNGLGRQY